MLFEFYESFISLNSENTTQLKRVRMQAKLQIWLQIPFYRVFIIGSSYLHSHILNFSDFFRIFSRFLSTQLGRFSMQTKYITNMATASIQNSKLFIKYFIIGWLIFFRIVDADINSFGCLRVWIHLALTNPKWNHKQIEDFLFTFNVSFYSGFSMLKMLYKFDDSSSDHL